MKAGAKVKVNCPVYRNGKTVYGTISKVNSDTQMSVIISGNSKSTKFAVKWLELV